MPELNAAAPSWYRLAEMERACDGDAMFPNRFRILLPYGYLVSIRYEIWTDEANVVDVWLEDITRPERKTWPDAESEFKNSISQNPLKIKFTFYHWYDNRYCPSKCWSNVGYPYNTLHVYAKKALAGGVVTLLNIKFYTLNADGTRGPEYQIPPGALEFSEVN